MTELKEFKDIDESIYENKKLDVEDCRNKSVRDVDKSCSNCSNVFRCDKIKEFVALQFEITTSKLKQCQQSNSLNSCMSCELFFKCENRKNYVNATYEKMNEGRGGEFDF
ncbi:MULTISPECIES: hypothetical protein [Campylobacter]|uniref:Uncharacterized protein n=3 Tax=Campylobacter fetus TaxID=196 RepID=A0A5L4XKL0_CAMFE|nr:MULTISPECIES: hypothetical protein [Campylobacter]OCS23406.1 hypothetical protein CFVI97532_01110 [Campylobacter fetus subsp. venerealis cfvi97/532]OCS26304.1 hypothetical protein CFVB10_04225 [Campylobacter fetus subsp. venerealis cfvB10]OCS30773.1 hypothetical protein CFVCCUG33900_01415 [Campylobacter fetus subsp. venerealis LMG 6570 = CCUG 33900]OCS43046.1 hypothetical protein CFVI02298_02015 [Campylobacter fetus subsp. venerealis cfvi02/298]AHE94265.1 hypothetical protein CFVI03293_0954